jgi:hypothetical protein
MGCNCNECHDPYSLPIGIQGQRGESGQQGERGIASTVPGPPGLSIKGDQGEKGDDSTVPGDKGDKGDGFTGGSYEPSTGITTFTSDDGLGFTTSDLRGDKGDTGDDGRGYDATSTNVINLPTGASATIIIEDEKAYTVGARVRVSDRNNPSTNYFEGICNLYNVVTGELNINPIDLQSGSGSINTWDVNLAGEPGANGTNGSVIAVEDEGTLKTSDVTKFNFVGAGVEATEAANEVTVTIGGGSSIIDTVWKDLPDHNGTYGIAPLTSDSGFRPKIRITGRTIYYVGRFMIPLSSDAGSTLYPDVSQYKLDGAGNQYSKVYSGSDGGFTPSLTGGLLGNAPMLPEDLFPDIDHRVDTYKIIERSINGLGNQFGSSLTLTSILTNVVFRSTGVLLMSTHTDVDDSSASAGTYDSTLHKIISNVNAGNHAYTYDSSEIGPTAGSVEWKTHVPQVGPIDAHGAGVSQEQIYPFDFNGDNPHDLGGFFIDLHFSYPADRTKTDQQLQDAFDAIV